MHSENIIYKNEMNEKTTKFLDKFVKRVKGNLFGVVGKILCLLEEIQYLS